MFAESAESRKTLGDVDVIYHEGLYHLFHLVLPNHDFIAHAVSENAVNWRRVANAIFIGHPGSWDDLMLWTMHVSPDPHQAGRWRMFYTGLSRRDRGLKQRLGMAVSDDLFHWTKTPVHWEDRRGRTDPERVQEAKRRSQETVSSCLQAAEDAESCFPLEPDPQFYESSLEDSRNWVSFRDPFYYRENERGWLLASGRVKWGPPVRRGCVAVMEETAPHIFEPRPALHHPGLYDDIEVPNLLKLDGEYYLIGSLREDAKIRYWHTDELGKPWRSYYDNVLLAKGNYAGRICRDEQGILLWNFFSADVHDRTVNNLLPPPKRLRRAANGQLRVETFEGFEERVRETIDTRCMKTLKANDETEYCRVGNEAMRLSCEAGFQAFVFDRELDSFRFRAQMRLSGIGKCGIVFRIDPESHDGYYLSLDLIKGVAQLRAWGSGARGSREQMMQFQTLQAGFWYSNQPGSADVQLIAFGSYLEFSIDGRVLLSLADQTFARGLVGVYAETAEIDVGEIHMNRLEAPTQSDEHLAQG